MVMIKYVAADLVNGVGLGCNKRFQYEGFDSICVVYSVSGDIRGSKVSSV